MGQLLNIFIKNTQSTPSPVMLDESIQLCYPGEAPLASSSEKKANIQHSSKSYVKYTHTCREIYMIVFMLLLHCKRRHQAL